MLEFILENVPLLLLAAGLVLMAFEALSPGAYFIVIGVALAGAGLIGVLFPPVANLLILAGLTLAIGFASAWVYREFDFYGGKGTAQTTDSSTLAGSMGYVTKAVTPRGGEVKLDDGGFNPYYRARSNEGTIEEGARVMVLDPGGGNVLTVEDMTEIETDDIDRALEQDAMDSAERSQREADAKREHKAVNETEREEETAETESE